MAVLFSRAGVLPKSGFDKYVLFTHSAENKCALLMFRKRQALTEGEILYHANSWCHWLCHYMEVKKRERKLEKAYAKLNIGACSAGRESK